MITNQNFTLKKINNIFRLFKLIIILLLFPLSIQSQSFILQTGTNSPIDNISSTTDFYKAPTFVDLDKDGDLDLVIGIFTGNYLYYTNNGSNMFTQQTGTNNPFNGIDSGGYATPTFVDLDKDGDWDLFTGRGDGTFKYYENNGTNIFIEITGKDNPLDGIDSGNYSSPTFVDLNNDNNLDMVTGGLDGTFKYYQNSGNKFTQLLGTDNPLNGIDSGDYSKPTFADLNNDGNIDFISGGASGTFKYYQNIGSNVFSLISNTTNPFWGIIVGNDSTPAFADLDNDGDLDLVSGERYGYLKYYQNQQYTLSNKANLLNKSNFTFYPNPVINSFTLETKLQINHIEVYNLLGERVKHFSPVGSNYNISELTDGIYFLKISTPNTSESIKFVKN